MSKVSTRATINANIKQNGNQEITGQILNSVLNTMVDDYAEQEKFTELEGKCGVIRTNAATFEESGFVIDGAWRKYTGYGSIGIPVRKYGIKNIKVTPDADTAITFLRDYAFSNSQSGAPVYYADGYNSLVNLSANMEREFAITENAEYIYILTKSEGRVIAVDIEMETSISERANYVNIWAKDAGGIISNKSFVNINGYDSVNVAVAPLHIYKITANPVQDAYISFLKAVPSVGSAVSFANGTAQDWLIIKAGESKYVQVQEDATVLNILSYNMDLSTFRTRRPLEVVDVTDSSIGFAHPRSIVYVAAADSAGEDKVCADFICSGTYDTDIIQKAVDMVAYGKFNAKGGEVVLFAGNYDIRLDQNRRVAIQLPSVNYEYTDIDTNTTNVTLRGYTHSADNVHLNLRQSIYDNLVDVTEWVVIGTRDSRSYCHHSVQNMHINIPSARKKIVCIDGSYLASLECIDVVCNVLDKGHYNNVGSYVPNFNCIGIRGNFGGNNMRNYEWKNCICYGFGQGFAVGGEHLLMIKCAALFCKYGFTFNSYAASANISNHPITAINCADEANFNLPLFCTLYDYKTGNPRGEMSQAVTFINFSLELHTDWLAVEGDRMKEQTPGQYYGVITYSNWGSTRIFENGSGLNFEVNNLQCKKIGSSEYRRSMPFQQMSQFYDTTINKMCYLIDRDNNLWVDANGNQV